MMPEDGRNKWTKYNVENKKTYEKIVFFSFKDIVNPVKSNYQTITINYKNCHRVVIQKIK
jgi:hypothetical protein